MNDHVRRCFPPTIFALLCACLLLFACAPATSVAPPDDRRLYKCANGVEFTALFYGGNVEIATRMHQYTLGARRSSIGTRYVSGTTAFAEDAGQAVLIGTEDGPFEACQEFKITDVR